MGVVSRQDRRAGAGLSHGTVAGDCTRERRRVAAVEREVAVVRDISRQAAGRAARSHLQRARIDAGSTRVGVLARQHRSAGAGLSHGTVAADRPAKRRGVTAIEREGRVVQHIADDAAGGAAGAKLQGAGADRGAAGIGLRGGEGGRAVAGLRDRSGPADDTWKRDRVAAVEGQRGRVGHVAHDAARGAARAERERATADRRATRIRVRPREGGGARAGLGEAACARHHSSVGQGIGAIERQRTLVRDVAGDAASGAAVTDRKRARRDCRAARVGRRARDPGRSRTLLHDHAGTGDRTREVQRVVAIESEGPVVRHVADDAAGRTARADRERAGADGRAARVGAGAGEGGRARPGLAHGAVAADHAAIRRRVAAIEGQPAAVRHVAGDAAGRSARSDRERARRDRGPATVDVGGGETRRARAPLHHRAGAADHAVEGRRVTAIERQCRVIGHVAGDAARRSARSDLERACRHRRAAGIRVGAGQHHRAEVGLVDSTRTGDRRCDRTRHAGAGSRAVADAQHGGGGGRREIAPADHITVGGELNPGNRDRAARGVDGDRARRPLEDGHATVPRPLELAVGRTPAGTRSGGRPRAVAARPDRQRSHLHEKVDLVGHARLHHRDEGSHRHAADCEAVVGQRPGVIDQSIQARAEAAGIRHIEEPVEGEGSVDLQQPVGARRAEGEAEPGIGAEGQGAGGEDTAGSAEQRATVLHRHGADRPRASEPAAGGDVHGARGASLVAVYEQGATQHVGGTGVGVVAGQGERTLIRLLDAARTGDDRRNGRGMPGAGRPAVAHLKQRVGRGRGERATRHSVAGGDELGAREVYRPGHVVDRDRARRAAERRDPALPGAVASAVELLPGRGSSRGAPRADAAGPVVGHGIREYEVNLIRRGRAKRQVCGIHRGGAELQRVVGERARVVDQPIRARREPA